MKQIMTLLALLFGVGVSQPVYANSEMFIVLDVRTPEEFADAHVKDAVNMDIMSADFTKRLANLDKEKPYKVYCRSGNRSGRAVQEMKAMGFKDVENLGSLAQAARRLNRSCQGKVSSC